MKLAGVLMAGLTGHALIQPARVDLRLNPAVTQESAQDTICVVGWTRSVRPPSAYTRRVKRELLREFDLPADSASDYVVCTPFDRTPGGLD